MNIIYIHYITNYTIFPVNHSCLLIALARVFSGIDDIGVSIDTQANLDTAWFHHLSSAHLICPIVIQGNLLDILLISSSQALSHCCGLLKTIWFWSSLVSPEVSIPYFCKLPSFTLNGLLFLSGLLVVVHLVILKDIGVVHPVPLAGLLSQ